MSILLLVFFVFFVIVGFKIYYYLINKIDILNEKQEVEQEVKKIQEIKKEINKLLKDNIVASRLQAEVNRLCEIYESNQKKIKLLKNKQDLINLKEEINLFKKENKKIEKELSKILKDLLYNEIYEERDLLATIERIKELLKIIEK
jgi:triacylglycerol esterase/lipase EstA (alpha/beta hydrolase family)